MIIYQCLNRAKSGRAGQLSRTRTHFVVSERRLIISGIPRHCDPSPDILLDLLDNRFLEDSYLRDRGRSQTLTLVLAERDRLPPINLLCHLAYRLSRRPEHRAVYDPWEIGGRPVNLVLAADMIGDVFRATTQPRLPMTSRH